MKMRKLLNRSDAQLEMQNWIHSNGKMPEVDKEYLVMRSDLQNIYKKVKEAYNRDYEIDSHFGLGVYTYLGNKSVFSERLFSNDDFWRYLSLKVIPDIVSDRWGSENESHFWKMSARIWLKQLWWYIHLTWQGNADRTLEVIGSENFNTDIILNLVERSGRKGYYVKVYRRITYYYSKLAKEEVISHSSGRESLFRKVMKLNTARVIVIEPALCMGQEQEYVQNLYKDLGVNF